MICLNRTLFVVSGFSVMIDVDIIVLELVFVDFLVISLLVLVVVVGFAVLKVVVGLLVAVIAVVFMVVVLEKVGLVVLVTGSFAVVSDLFVAVISGLVFVVSG